MRGVARGAEPRKTTAVCGSCGTPIATYPSQNKRFCSKACGKRGVPVERFWGKVDKSSGPDGCWVWTGSLTHDGYGRFTVDKVQRLAHRYSYAVTYAEPAPDDLVCHRCDVRSCCNPVHLFIGTHAINSADMVTKGRQAAGERNNKAKLTEEQVRDIRWAYTTGLSQRQLAREYSVSKPVIAGIVNGTLWKCVA